MAELTIEENSAVLTNVLEFGVKNKPILHDMVRTHLSIAGFGLYDDNTPPQSDYSVYKDKGKLIGWCDMLQDNPDQSHPIIGNRVLSQSEFEYMEDGSVRTRIVGEFGTSTAIGNISKVRVFGQLVNEEVLKGLYNSRKGVSAQYQTEFPLVPAFKPGYLNQGIFGVFRKLTNYNYGGAACHAMFSGVLGDGRFYTLKDYSIASSFQNNTALEIVPHGNARMGAAVFTNGIGLFSPNQEEGKEIQLVLPVGGSTSLSYSNWKYFRTTGSPVNNNIYQFSGQGASNALSLVIYDESTDYSPESRSITLSSVLASPNCFCVTAKMDGTFDVVYLEMDTFGNTVLVKQNYDPSADTLGEPIKTDMGVEMKTTDDAFWRTYVEDESTGIAYLGISKVYGGNESSSSKNCAPSLTMLGIFRDLENGTGELFIADHASSEYTEGINNLVDATDLLSGAKNDYNYINHSVPSAYVGSSWATSGFPVINPINGKLVFIAGDLRKYSGEYAGDLYIEFEPVLPTSIIAEAQVTELVKTDSDQLRVILDVILKVTS